MLAQGLAELERRAQFDPQLAADLHHAKSALSVVHGGEIDVIKQQELAAQNSLVRAVLTTNASFVSGRLVDLIRKF